MSRWSPLAFVLLFGLSCNQPAKTPTTVTPVTPPAADLPGAIEGSGDVIATVNNKQIQRNLLDAAVRTFPPLMRTQLDKSENLGQLVDSLVTTELLYQEAITQGIEKKPDLKASLALAERKALADAMMYQVLEQRITDERIKAWYEDHKIQYTKAQVHLGLIVVASKPEAEAIKGALAKGADFAQIAAAKSGHPSSASGGDVGWVPVDQLDAQLKGVGSQKVGAIMGPVDIGGALHIFKVLERKETGRSLEDAREEIQLILQKEIMEEYVKEIRTKSTVMISANLSAAPAAAVPGGAAPAGAALPAGAPGAAPAKAPVAPATKAPAAPAAPSK